MKHADRFTKVLVLDTETLSLENPLVYNIGWTIQRPDGTRVYREFQIQEILNHPAYKDRYYKRELTCSVVPMQTVMEILARDIEWVDGNIWAYNSKFDTKAINLTCHYLGIDSPLDADGIRDLLPTVRKTLKADGRYTKTGYTVEKVCQFIYDSDGFIEEHTALADSQNEFDIWNYFVGRDFHTRTYRQTDSVIFTLVGTDNEENLNVMMVSPDRKAVEKRYNKIQDNYNMLTIFEKVIGE
jgi:hypothetical protein